MARNIDVAFESDFNTFYHVSNIGEGGSGRVVEVKDQDEKIFALKYLHPDRITTNKRKRFKNELAFCERDVHLNIIKVFDHGHIFLKKEKCPFYVMPRYGHNLRKLMKNGIDSKDVLPFFSQILNGVEAAHFLDVWHRDLKPENILVDLKKNLLVIADFGIAHFAEPVRQTNAKTKPGDWVASVNYAAPEQRERLMEGDHRADIWTLGLILNELYTGRLAVGSDFMKISDIDGQYEYLDDLVHLMLKQDVDKRPQSIDEIKEELIGRKNAFIVRQKLDHLQKTVIKTSDVDDPFVSDPVRLVAIDYSNKNLIFKLSKAVNSQWIEAFQRMEGFRYSPGIFEPSLFSFRGDTASIPFYDDRDSQQFVDFFKSYLKRTTETYKARLIKAQQAKELEEKEKLQSRIEEQRRRESIIKNVKI